MSRVDIRINLSFKNNKQEVDLYNFVTEKGEIMGVSSYIKMLIQKAMIEDELNKTK